MVEYKELKLNQPISFIQKTDNYGIAFFDFCFEINKEDRIEKVYISPRQQPDKDNGWVLQAGFSEGFHIESKDHEHTPQWHVINGFYCSIHKSMSISVYCPDNTTILVCEYIGSDIWFKFK